MTKLQSSAKGFSDCFGIHNYYFRWPNSTKVSKWAFSRHGSTISSWKQESQCNASFPIFRSTATCVKKYDWYWCKRQTDNCLCLKSCNAHSTTLRSSLLSLQTYFVVRINLSLNVSSLIIHILCTWIINRNYNSFRAFKHSFLSWYCLKSYPSN